MQNGGETNNYSVRLPRRDPQKYLKVKCKKENRYIYIYIAHGSEQAALKFSHPSIPSRRVRSTKSM